MLFAIWMVFVVGIVMVGFTFVGLCLRHYYLEYRRRLDEETLAADVQNLASSKSP